METSDGVRVSCPLPTREAVTKDVVQVHLRRLPYKQENIQKIHGQGPDHNEKVTQIPQVTGENPSGGRETEGENRILVIF